MGLTVPDLDAAVAFFTKALGCEELHRIGPFVAEDDWMQRRLGVHPRAVIPQVVMMRCGDDAMFELFEYEAPDQQENYPKQSDIGGYHIAFYVDDLPGALEHLVSFGATVLDEPTVMTSGPTQGETWVYLRTPWDLPIELVTRR